MGLSRLSAARSSQHQAQPAAVFHRARRLSILPSAVLLRDRKAGRRASRLSRFPQPDHSATKTHNIFFPTARVPESLRSRIRKTLAVNRVPRFTHRMRVPNNAASKLSASLTRQHRKRQAVPCVDNLARVAKPPVASPLVPHAATDTLRVSAPSASPPCFCQPVISRGVEVRP